jgi:hypothetical protein
MPSLQLTSLVAVGGVGVQAEPVTQVWGTVLEQAPVPPPERLQARVAQALSAAQFVWQAVTSETKVTFVVAVPLEPVAVRVAVPVQPGVAELHAVSVTLAEAPLIVAVEELPGKEPRPAGEIVSVTDPPPVFVTSTFAVFVPLATSDVGDAEMVTTGGGGAEAVWASSFFVQPASTPSEHRTASVRKRPYMRKPSQRAIERPL